MEGILANLVTTTLGGSWGAVLAVLMLALAALIKGHRELRQQLQDKDDEIGELLDKQQSLLDRIGELQRHATDRYEALLRERSQCKSCPMSSAKQEHDPH